MNFPLRQTKAGKSCFQGLWEQSVEGTETVYFRKPVAEQMVRDYFQELRLVSFQLWTSQRGLDAFIKKYSP